jgi:DNA ligase 4
MKATVEVDPSEISQLAEKLHERVQAGASGSFASLGWLFKGLTFYFHNSRSTDEASDSDSQPGEQADMINKLHRPCLASNLASFGGASTASAAEKAVTHVIVDVDCSSSELSALRGSLSIRLGKRKLPHLVTVEWVERSWKERTLLSEESRLENSHFIKAKLTFQRRVSPIRMKFSTAASHLVRYQSPSYHIRYLAAWRLTSKKR